ncbi:MAG: hypothetical protein J3Q66DRAFT_349576 [Benniella sp.]|nr:MAG: hypothetical protein J3Q66DRAFT_349576 [Benniella sp.]
MQPEEPILAPSQSLSHHDQDQEIQEAQEPQNEKQSEQHDSTSRNSSELSLGSLLRAIQPLSQEEALKEEERAAEKIRQNLRPISKIQSVRRNIAQSRYNDDSAPESVRNSQVLEPQPQGTEPSSSPNNRVSVASMVTNTFAGSAVGSSADLPGKTARTSKKNAKLIEIEPQRLVDAQTTPGDRRYFKGPEDPEPEGNFVYDFLYQHQRGVFILGAPKFSSKSLLPIDPDEWTDQNFNTSAMNTTDYALPDPSWEWVHKSWLVDMTGDVDEDGWEYAMTFHGSAWHGSYEVFRSFARRRRWLRLRRKKGKPTGKPGPLPERAYPTSVQSAAWTKLDVSQSYLDDPSPFPPDDSATDEDPQGSGRGGSSSQPRDSKKVDLYKAMKKARSDREKLSYAAQYVVRYPGDLEDLEKRLDRYLNLLDYENSRREFLSLITAYSGVKKDIVTNTAAQLAFYSDQKQLLTGRQS